MINLDRETLNKLYTQEHLTMQQIGNIYKVSRVYICKLIKRYNISVYEGGHVKVNCALCNKEKEIYRGVYRRQKGLFYCSAICYYKHRAIANNYQGENRTEQRHARKIYEEVSGIKLIDKQTIHHIDGNCNNNDISNLMLFNSNAEHMAYHHKLRIAQGHI